MVMALLGMDMPKPIEEGAVKISWDRSGGKIRTTIVLDFGKTNWSAEKAVEKQGYIVRSIRRHFGVKLSRILQ